jgi:hypothetical protein
MDVPLDRSSLHAMKKGHKESVREYTQKWCETTAQVNPYLLEKEMINLFANISKPHTLNTWLEALYNIFMTWLP